MEGVEIMMANQVWRLGGGGGGDKWDRGEMEVEGEMEKGWREWREVEWERGVGWEEERGVGVVYYFCVQGKGHTVFTSDMR